MTIQQAIDFVKWYNTEADDNCDKYKELKTVFDYACKIVKGEIRNGSEKS